MTRTRDVLRQADRARELPEVPVPSADTRAADVAAALGLELGPEVAAPRTSQARPSVHPDGLRALAAALAGGAERPGTG